MQWDGACCARLRLRGARRRRLFPDEPESAAVWLARAKEQDWDADAMLDPGGSGTQEEVAEEAVAVSAHGDEVTTFVFDPLDDLVGGFSVGQFGIGGDVGGLQFGLNFVEVGGVVDDLLTDGVGTIGSGGPSVGNVEQDKAAVGEPGELFHVFDNGAVGWGAIERD